MRTDDSMSSGTISQSDRSHVPAVVKRRIPLREGALLARYHFRILNRWLFLFILLSFLGFAVLLWFQLRGSGSENSRYGIELSQFVLEPYAGLLAAMLGSSLIVSDPPLEVILTARTGAYGLVVWRFLLSFLILLLCSAVYLFWSLGNGISYDQRQDPLFILLVWLAPVLIMSMLSLFGSLVTHNAALGMTIAIVPLAGSLFLYEALAPLKVTHWFFISYTYSGGADTPDWWANRLTLLVIALVLAAWSGWLLRNDERLVNHSH
jgi:hypothetical protein